MAIQSEVSEKDLGVKVYDFVVLEECADIKMSESAKQAAHPDKLDELRHS